MDLIYTDVNRKDIGVLKDYGLDLAFGSDENDFELVIDLNNHCCEADCLVYIEGTEYGGIIDKIGVITADEKLTYHGRTWQGIVASKVIVPSGGKSHLTVSGEANKILGDLFSKLGLDGLFVASDEDSGIQIEKYSFDRYINAYLGISKMLESASGKLKFSYVENKVIVSALPAVDYTKDEQFDSDNVEMQLEKTKNTVNHLICLGKGELTERKVVHLYMDKNGRVGQKQSFFGLQEIVDTYDYPNAESVEELVKDGTAKLQELASTDKVQMDFTAEDNRYDVGDIVGAKEIITDTIVSARITKKIVTINQGVVNIQYKVGE